MLGSIGADLAMQLGDLAADADPRRCCRTRSPSSSALFLPLAAWLIASRRDEWEELLAATFVTVAIAIPLVVGAAFLEVYVWPDILRAVSPSTEVASRCNVAAPPSDRTSLCIVDGVAPTRTTR